MKKEKYPAFAEGTEQLKQLKKIKKHTHTHDKPVGKCMGHGRRKMSGVQQQCINAKNSNN